MKKFTYLNFFENSCTRSVVWPKLSLYGAQASIDAVLWRKWMPKRACWTTDPQWFPMARIGSCSRLGRNLKSYVWVCPDSAFELSAASRWSSVVAYKWLLTSWKKEKIDSCVMLAYDISYLKSNTASIGALFDYIRRKFMKFRAYKYPGTCKGEKASR